jgi:hypothetical protein
MKYLKEYKIFESVNEEEIHSVCDKYDIKNYTINTDGTIDVDGNIDLNNKGLTKLPLKFNRVTGFFYCDNNQLTSLEGAPVSVGNFYCHNNKLTSLEGAPQSVRNFVCYDNQLTSLEGAPQSVGSDFYCHNNKLTSLKGLEFKSFDEIYLEDNPIYTIVKSWINNDNREDLIEYFVDINIIQEGGDKPKLIMMRLEAFYEDMNLKMNIDFNEVKKYYEIIE